MPVSLSTIAAKDGAAATLVGGLLAMDKSGAGTGPWSLAHVLVDGVAGTLLAQITAANALKVDGSGVTQPVSLTSTTISGTVAVTQSGAWSLSANQSVNAAQINGVAPLMGNGVTGTGSQRVTVASDNTPFAVKIDQTTNGTTNKVAADLRVAGAAVDLGVGTGGAATPRIAIDSSQITTTGTAGTPSAQVVSVQGVAGGTSQPVTPADQYAQYETVAASATAQALGATGATGDYLAGVLVFPATAGCGVVTILDNTTTIGTFPGGGTTALADLRPFMIPVGLFSVSGAWKVTTGANVAAVGIGKFT